MHERVAQEIALVKERYPSVQAGEQLDWLLIPEFPLPPGRYDRATTKLLFRIPPGYPSTGPDDFFVERDLQLKGGGTGPGFNANNDSSSGPAPIAGSWGWFSWHPQSWRPTAQLLAGDNLLTFLRSVQRCLSGEEST